MRYKNSEMKIDQLVSYLNDEKINLSPAFQRGHVWKLNDRRNLVRNIVLGRPIPAVFLYKEAAGSKYSYNILDGKQRLESLILFIADGHKDIKIENWNSYFYGKDLRKSAGFTVPLDNRKQAFAKLPDERVRELLEYSIPTIEISLDDKSTLDEVITLFVDINQQGAAVKRFDIVKAMYKRDPLMRQTFELIADEQERGQDILYKLKSSVFTRVLRELQVVKSATSQNAQVDKMWEKLLEIALFVRSRKHNSASAALKEFIAPRKGEQASMLKKSELAQLRSAFTFLNSIRSRLGTSRLLTDQTHSYTLVTSLIGSDLVSKYGKQDLTDRIIRFAVLIDEPGRKPPKVISKVLDEYREESTKQTTHLSRRINRDQLFIKLIDTI